MARRAFMISIGRLQAPFWREAAEFYRNRLRAWDWREVVIKDVPSLPPEARRAREGEAILAALPAGYTLICLDAGGEQLDSPAFARRLETLWAEGRPPCFILGGAYGLHARVLERAHRRLSLGAMTFTHELAQALLWEQLFRADSILRRTGYHH